ncbi:MAG TPA: TolC family protein, partial [Rhodothermales bacterium]|nr:TolC family protein [Rhodothermales bacterium]
TPGRADALRAELLQVAQQQAEVRYDRGTMLDVLHVLTGFDLGDDTKLVLPGVEVPDSITVSRDRPEFALFALQRQRIAQQARLSDARLRPRISAFAQGGYGRPGYDFLDNSLHPFWQGGVRVQWSPWDWHNTEREHQAAALQEEVVTTRQEAFARGLRVNLQKDRNDIRRLREVIRADRELVRLREQIAAEAARQFDAGVLTGADYVQRRNDAFQAELVEQQHRVELVQKQVHYLTTLGRYPQ